MRFLCLVLMLFPASAREFSGAHGENIRGAVLTTGNPPALITWGDRLIRWSLTDRAKKVLATPDAPFSQGGCAIKDGTGLFLQEGKSPGKLVLRQAPTWNTRTIDTGIDMPNCLAVTLLGHKGVLMVNRGMQMRFYEYADFYYREIYSFYNPSRPSRSAGRRCGWRWPP